MFPQDGGAVDVRSWDLAVIKWREMPVQIGRKPESGFNNPLRLLSDCHRRIEQFLGVLIQVCGTDEGAKLGPEETVALEKALEYFRNAAPKHTADEEESLFPRLRAGPEAQATINCMDALESDHAAAGRDHETVEALGREWLKTGKLDSGNRQEMKLTLERLARMYAKHIEIEDKELFPLAERVLSPDALAKVGEEMAERRGVHARQGR